MCEMKCPRVWDDVLGKVLYSRFEQFDDSIGFRFSEHLETENPKYMWPTGLKDKNGKEIYEGDIVKSLLGPVTYNDNLIGVIRFEEGSWLVKWREHSSYLHVRKHNIEIIGNIYENSDLLTRAIVSTEST